MSIKLAATILAASVLSGCITGIPYSAATSGTASVTGGVVDADLSQEENGRVSVVGVGVIAYVTGVDTERGKMVASSGISGSPTVGAARTSGSATYTTTYAYGVIDNISRTNTRISGTRGSESGVMTLTADFDANTVNGSNDDLTVNGGISGTTLTGAVTADYSFAGAFGSVSGVLNGQIGETGIIGTFHGHDDNTVMAGGLVGTAD